MQQKVDPGARLSNRLADPDYGLRIQEVHRVVVHRPASALDRSHGGPGSVAPLDGRQLTVDEGRGGAFAGLLQPLEDGPFQTLLVRSEGDHVRIRLVRQLHQVEQVEGAAGRPGQVGGDGRHDAAGRARDDEDGVWPEVDGGLVGEFHLVDGDRPPHLVEASDLDGTWVMEGFLDQRLGERRRPAAGREVDGLHQGVRLLPLVGLGEPGDGSSQRREGAAVVVAMPATEAGGGHQERPTVAHRLVEVAHRGVQELDPDAKLFLPLLVGQFGDGPWIVESRQPVHAGDRTFGTELVDGFEEFVDPGSILDVEDIDALLGQLFDEGLPNASRIAEDHDPGRLEFDAGGRTGVE